MVTFKKKWHMTLFKLKTCILESFNIFLCLLFIILMNVGEIGVQLIDSNKKISNEQWKKNSQNRPCRNTENVKFIKYSKYKLNF